MKRNGILLGIVAALTLACAPRANATIEIKLVNGASSVDVKDGDALDTCAAVNCVTYNGPVGNWSINVSTGTADNNNPPFLDLNSVDKTSNGTPGDLTIQTSQNGYTPATKGFRLDVGGTRSSGSVSFSAFGGTNNTLFDMSNQIGSTLTFNTNAYSGSTQTSFVTVSPYELTIQAVLSPNGADSVSFDAGLTPIPEPAAVVLLGSVLLFIVSMLRRKYRQA